MGGYLIKILAPKGTKGAAMDGVNVGQVIKEYEYLLNKGQKYITKSVSEEDRLIEIILIK